MPYDVSISEHPDHMRFRYEGAFTYEDWLKMYKEIGQWASSSDTLNILVEEGPGTSGDLSVFDVFWLTKRCALDFFPPAARVAVVIPQCSEPTLHLARFAETVAHNRGLTLSFFDQIAEAEAWLPRARSGSVPSDGLPTS